MPLTSGPLGGILHQMNPWWDRGTVPGTMLGVPRPAQVDRVISAMDRGRVALVTGPRRSGKTTILYQCVQRLIDAGVVADRVLFAMLDHPILMGGSSSIGDVVEWFMAEFKHPRDRQLHVFLDEAHRARGWGEWAKTVHDTYRFPLALSGSSAMELEAVSMAGLTGRHEPVGVRPLRLAEYMDFRGIAPSRGDEHIMPRLMDDYLLAGGFPEAVRAPDEFSRRSLLLHLFEDILLGDIVGMHPIRDVATLRDIATMVLSSTGTSVSYRKIARAVDCSVDTAEDYVGHMVACHLLTEVPFHSRSAGERARNPSKYYPIDTGMLDAVVGGAARGALAETAVAGALAAGPRGRGPQVGYWKDVKEVDFVVGTRGLEAYEVKYRDALGGDELRGVRAFLERRGKARVTVITRSLSGTMDVGGHEVRMLPLWRFMLEGGEVDGGPGPRRP